MIIVLNELKTNKHITYPDYMSFFAFCQYCFLAVIGLE